MNTKITYLYRDASNYKQWNEQIVAGTLTANDVAEIMSKCDGEEWFIPSQVGLPEERFDKFLPDVDHVWFELEAGWFEETNLKPTEQMTAQELLANFRAVKNWEDAKRLQELIREQ